MLRRTLRRIIERLKDLTGKKRRTREVYDKIFGLYTLDLSFLDKELFREIVQDVKRVKNVSIDWENKKVIYRGVRTVQGKSSKKKT